MVSVGQRGAKLLGYGVHPAAELFPLLEGQELVDLAEDIKRNGQREPVILYKGQILDGRNRLRACKLAGVEPEVEAWEGDNPVGYVLSANLHRRHLDPSARAMVVAKAAELIEKLGDEARERKLAGLKRGAASPVPANLPARGEVREQLAQLGGISPRLVQSARKVLVEGTKELVEAASRGQVAVSDAERIVVQPPRVQRVALEAVVEGRAKNLVAAVKRDHKETLLRQIQREPPPMPVGPYRVIVADPSWKYDLRDEDDTHRGKTPYPPMTVEEICALKVPEICHRDCVLYLWFPNAMVRTIGRVLDAWGFPEGSEKTLITWDKMRIGLGHYRRNQTEQCVIATRGKPVFDLTNQSTLIEEAPREHSRKPDKFFLDCEAVHPGPSKVELFSRQRREGWAQHGAELDKFIALPPLVSGAA